jgi:hypothetical protein
LQQIDPAVEYIMRNAPCEVLVLSRGEMKGNHYENGYARNGHEENALRDHFASSSYDDLDKVKIDIGR